MSYPDWAIHKQKAGAPLEDPGPFLFTRLLTRCFLGSPGVLGRAHRHPLQAHLLLCAVGQQGAEPQLARVCITERTRACQTDPLHERQLDLRRLLACIPSYWLSTQSILAPPRIVQSPR